MDRFSLPHGFCLLAGALFACSTMADANGAQPVAVKSNLVSFGEGNYQLTATSIEDLQLTHVVQNESRSWLVKPEFTLSENLRPEWNDKEEWNSTDKSVKKIVLARQKRGLILAIVHTINGGNSCFWGMRLDPKETAAKANNNLKPAIVLLAMGTANEMILSVSADIHPPAFTLVTGVLSEKPGQISGGAITFEWCGVLESALSGKYVPTYPASKFE